MPSTATAQTPREISARLVDAAGLEKLRERLRAERDESRIRIRICMTGCRAHGAEQVMAAFREEIRRRGLSEVEVVGTGCHGFCALAPVLVVEPAGIFYGGISVEDVPEIVSETVVAGRAVERLLYRDPATGRSIPLARDIPFYQKQTRIVLRNCGDIDPKDIGEYIRRDGYAALAKALFSMSPEGVVQEVTSSGLRGRGGAGFPTGKKWSLAAASKGSTKYIVCNADEGDPGAFMDRAVLEGDPHSIIEGMAIAAYAIGATEGIVYVRAEYPIAVEHMHIALEQAASLGLLGERILGSAFSFTVRIKKGSGAFVCGEETALMASIEGRRGMPRPRPPFPAQSGIWGKPTCINNVETLANIAPILLKGGSWYASMGTEKSKGTKVFALAGKVRNTGLIEIPIGTSLGEIVLEIGGGVRGGRRFKAAQIGGPSGGCIPREHLNVPVDYESLTSLGAIMGSGGLVVMDEDTCMVDVARFFMDFIQDESCGKCVPCRIGTKRMLESLEEICAGRGTNKDIELLRELAGTIKDGALCGLGQTAPNSLLSALRYFDEEFVEHIRDGRCRAGVCPDLVRAPCQNSCPAAVDIPGWVSLVAEGRFEEASRLHRERNPFVQVCSRVCDHPCEGRCRRSTLDEPLSIRGIKRYLAEQEPEKLPLPEVRVSASNAARQVAIVGGGPAGLTCAYFLARLGYRPTVYEAEARAGGMLVQAIPAYRLPREAVEREIEMIRSMGVEIRTGARLGRDFTLSDLRVAGAQAVFVAVGAPVGVGLGLGLNGAEVDALEFLRSFNLTGAARVGERVLVVGGGNAAIDSARTALRLGAKEVTVAYRRTRAEMPAYEEEIAEAEREGVRLELLVAPVGIVEREGKLVGVRLDRMTLADYDTSGRRRAVSVANAELIVEADMVIAAVGQRLHAPGILSGEELRLNERDFIAADPVTGQTSLEWVFAGGDAATGPSSVIEAIAAGERAAVGIDRYLTGAGHDFWRQEKKVDTFFDPDREPVVTPRARPELVPAALRARNFREVETCLRGDAAHCEAGRCLRCEFRRDESGES